MKTDFSEAIEVQSAGANLFNYLKPLLTRLERGEEFGLAGESRGLSEEDIKRKAKITQVAQLMLVTIDISSSTWDTVIEFPSLVAENTLLRGEIERIKQRLAELERRMPEEKVIVLREISREQAKQEIQELFSNGRTLYYSDIAEELRLDLELVVDICRELQGSGEIKVDENAL